MDEKTLIDEVVRGDELAEEEFVAKFRLRVRAALGALGVREPDVDDVSQEVFIDAFRQLRAGMFKKRSAPGTWLWTIVHGKAIDHFGCAASKRAARTEALKDQLPNLRVSADQEVLLLTADALAQLPPRLQLIFRLKFQQNRSDEEIAEKIGCTVTRMRNLATEARERFSALILGREFGKKRPVRRLTRRAE